MTNDLNTLGYGVVSPEIFAGALHGDTRCLERCRQLFAANSAAELHTILEARYTPAPASTGPLQTWQLVACLGTSFTQRAIKADSLPAAVAELRRQLALCNVAVYAVPSFAHTLDQTGRLAKIETTIQRPNKLYHLLLCQRGRCFAREVWQVSAVAACRALLYKLQARQLRCRKAESADGRQTTLDPGIDAGALLLVCGFDQLSETASYPD